eukprot:1882777-Lingulodinium_polyedra.AAC.1
MTRHARRNLSRPWQLHFSSPYQRTITCPPRPTRRREKRRGSMRKDKRERNDIRTPTCRRPRATP